MCLHLLTIEFISLKFIGLNIIKVLYLPLPTFIQYFKYITSKSVWHAKSYIFKHNYKTIKKSFDKRVYFSSCVLNGENVIDAPVK